MESTNTKTLGNKLAETEKEANESTDTTPAIKNIALTGKDAENMNNTTNPTKKRGNINQNRLTQKNNKNPTKIQSQNQNQTETNNDRNDNTNETNDVKEDMEESNDNSVANTSTNATDANASGANATGANNDKAKMRSLNNVAMNLFNHQVVMKLFHFQTELYGAHKASDGYLEKFAGTMDKFLEIAQGIYGRITIKKYTLSGSSHTDANIVKHLEGIITLLREKIDDILDNYTDLINIRDELVGDLEQLKYLLTFK
jgi:hypothetical protein